MEVDVGCEQPRPAEPPRVALRDWARLMLGAAELPWGGVPGSLPPAFVAEVVRQTDPACVVTPRQDVLMGHLAADAMAVECTTADREGQGRAAQLARLATRDGSTPLVMASELTGSQLDGLRHV